MVFAAVMAVVFPADVTKADGIDVAQIAAGAVGVVRMAAPAALEAGAAAEAGGAGAGVAGAVCATGVGCAVLAVAAVGLLAYSTRDAWLPYVQQGITSLNDHPGPDGSALGQSVVAWPTQPPADLAGQEACDSASWWWDDGDASKAAPVNCGSVTIQMTYPTMQFQGCCNYTPQWDKDEYGQQAVATTVCRPVEGGPDATIDTLYHDWLYFKPQSGVDARRMTLTPCSALSNTYAQAIVQRPDAPTPNAHYVPIKITVRGSHDNAGFLATWTAPWADTIGGPTQVRAVTLCRPAGGPSDGSQDYLMTGDATDSAHAGLVQVKACNPGDTALAVSTEQGRNNVWQTTNRTDLTALRADDARYPQCAGGACGYQVFVDHAACTATTQGTDCANWAVIAKADPSRVECHYGPYVVNVADCYPLERAYEPGGAPATGANTDGDPDTYTSPAPVRTPVTTPSPTATSTATSTPTASPGTGTDPGTGMGTSPGSAGSPSTSDPASERDCFPGGWAALNPVQWVLHPIRCAFEPDPARSAARQTQVSNDLSHTGITPLLGAATSVVGQLGGASGSGAGCLGPEVTFSMSGVTQSLHPFAACDPPISYLAAMARAVISLTVIIGGALGLVRAVGSGFGWSFAFGRSGGEG